MLIGSFLNLGIRITSVILLLLVNVQLARMLGPEGYGLLAFTMAWVQILALFAQFGLPSYLLRTVTLTLQEAEYGRSRDVVASAFIIVLGAGLLCAATVAGATRIFWFPSEGSAILLPALILMLALGLGPPLSGALRGLGWITWSQIPEQIVRPGLLCMALACWAFSEETLRVSDALWLQFTMALCAVGVGATSLLRCMPKSDAALNLHPLRHARLAAPFLLLSVVLGLSQHVTIFVLGLMTSASEVALFRVANQVSDALIMLLYGISVMIGPRIVRLHSSQDWGGMQRLLARSHGVAFLMLLAPVAILALWGEPLLGWVFGVAYAPAHGVMIMLALGRLLYALVGFSGLALTLMGQARAAMWNSLAGLTLTVAILVLILPEWGLSGAALAVIAGTVCSEWMNSAKVSKAGGKNTSAFGLFTLWRGGT